MRWLISIAVGLILGFGAGVLWAERPKLTVEKLPEVVEKIGTPLLKYTVEALGGRTYASQIVWGEQIATDEAFWVQKFYFDSDGKTVSGLAHIPSGCSKCPVIIQVRGYADKAVYRSGYGTWRSAEKYAQAGFISLAPDFLGYGESASPSGDVFEERFEKYTTVLNLLAAASQWPQVDSQKVGLWGHSNGGQIVVTVLEATGKTYPSTLWAPVTASFPYSILYYMNESSEGDRELRQKLAEFETVYDSDKFNPLNYLDRIRAPLLVHQGTADTSVPVEWNRNFRRENINIDYREYPGADHNLVPYWEVVVERDIAFFKENLGLTK